jgi:hypothetical protein
LSSNGGTVPAQIATLLELAMFLAMGAFIILSLPAIAEPESRRPRWRSACVPLRSNRPKPGCCRIPTS